MEILDLRTCLATRRVLELLSEIVTEVLGPEGSLKETAQTWDLTARGLFVEDDSSGVEDYHEYSGNDDEVETDNEWSDNSPEWSDDSPEQDDELPSWFV